MPSRTAIIWTIALVCGLTGCAPHRMEAPWPEPSPLGKDFPTHRPPHQPSSAASASPQDEEPSGVITLPQALALALMKNPELAAFSWEARAREAQTLQAGALPNPEIGVGIEDIGGSQDFRGFRQSQTTVQLSQLIELGGKRFKRVRVTSLTRDLAGWDYEIKRLDVLTLASQAFIDVSSAEQLVTLREEMVRLAERVARTVSERVEAGKVSPVEETGAGVALASARIELERAKRALDASRKRLSATWGSTTPRFEKAEGDLSPVPSLIPSLEQWVERLSQNPELVRWTVELSQRQAVVELEKSRAIPDLTMSGGGRWLNETSDHAFVLEASIPLPFFDRNRGGILEARYRLAKGETERRAAEVRVATALAEAYQALSTAHAEATTLRASVLPGAQSVFDAVNEGYRLGKFGYLAVLDAQRTLFDARVQTLKALTDYHKAVAEVERLIGEPMGVVNESGERKEEKE